MARGGIASLDPIGEDDDPLFRTVALKLLSYLPQGPTDGSFTTRSDVLDGALDRSFVVVGKRNQHLDITATAGMGFGAIAMPKSHPADLHVIGDLVENFAHGALGKHDAGFFF